MLGTGSGGHGREGVQWEGQQKQGIAVLEQGRTWAVCVRSEGREGLIFALEDQNLEYADMNIFPGISRFEPKNCENWLYVYLIYMLIFYQR